MVFVHLALSNKFRVFFYALLIHYITAHGKDVIVWCNCLSWSVYVVLKICGEELLWLSAWIMYLPWHRYCWSIRNARSIFLNSFCYRTFVVLPWAAFLECRFLDSCSQRWCSHRTGKRQTVSVIFVPEIFYEYYVTFFRNFLCFWIHDAVTLRILVVSLQTVIFFFLSLISANSFGTWA